MSTFSRRDVDALLNVLSFCHEKSVGYGGWYEDHARDLSIADSIASRLDAELPPRLIVQRTTDTRTTELL